MPVEEDAAYETFESAESGASATFPVRAGTVRAGSHVVVEGRPCRVVEAVTGKTGKHGHAKTHFVAVDIFTGRKYEMFVPSSHCCDAPVLTRRQYTLLHIDDDGFLSLSASDGSVREDLALPTGTPEADRLAATLAEKHGRGLELVVTVTGAMGTEVVSDASEA